MTVTAEQIAKVKAAGFVNVQWIADACSRTGCRFYIAVAMIDKEGLPGQKGRNRYGSDAGGALRGYNGEVDAGSYTVFRWMIDAGVPVKQPDGSHKIIRFGPNGVGPAQITHPDLVREMEVNGLDIRVPEDNIYYGVRRIYGFYRYARDEQDKSTWESLWYAGKRYNGGDAYAKSFADTATKWRETLGNADYA